MSNLSAAETVSQLHQNEISLLAQRGALHDQLAANEKSLGQVQAALQGVRLAQEALSQAQSETEQKGE